MSEFQSELARLKQRIEGNLPPRFVKIMHAATRALEVSGQAARMAQPGAQVPAFALPDQHGELRLGPELYAQGPLAITFYRGFWCPYCNADLANLNRYVPDITAKGATLIAVSPEKSEYSRKIIGMHRLKFDILADARNQVAAKFGLRYALPGDLKALYRDSLSINLKLYHGDDDWTLPMPARFLVDTAGTIRYAEASADYTRRPDPDDLMAALSAL